MKLTTLFASLAVAALAFTAAPTFAGDDDKAAKDDKKASCCGDKSEKDSSCCGDKGEVSVAKVGEAAPSFTLTDMQGKEHSLSDYEGKIVMLTWFSPDCPFVVKHYENGANTFNDLREDFSKEGVVFLFVNSAHEGHMYADEDVVNKRVEKWKIEEPILVDADGKVGKAYQAKRTPEVYIIGKDGKLAYHGAIDNDNSTRTIGKVNYAREALNSLINGETIDEPETKAYGCSVKYAKK